MSEFSKKDTAQAEEQKTPPVFTREALLGMERPKKVVTPPGYEGSVEIQALTAWEQSEYQSGLINIEYRGGKDAVTRPNLAGADARLCARGAVNPKMTDREWGGLPNDLVTFLAKEIRDLSGMSISVEEAVGNSGTEPDSALSIS